MEQSRGAASSRLRARLKKKKKKEEKQGTKENKDAVVRASLDYNVNKAKERRDTSLHT